MQHLDNRDGCISNLHSSPESFDRRVLCAHAGRFPDDITDDTANTIHTHTRIRTRTRKTTMRTKPYIYIYSRNHPKQTVAVSVLRFPPVLLWSTIHSFIPPARGAPALCVCVTSIPQICATVRQLRMRPRRHSHTRTHTVVAVAVGGHHRRLCVSAVFTIRSHLIVVFSCARARVCACMCVFE